MSFGIEANRATVLGAEAGCPFCRARTSRSPSPGDLVFALSGPSAGRSGKIATPAETARQNGVYIHFDYTNPEDSQFFSLENGLLIRLDQLSLPKWLPPLRLKFLSLFEEFIHQLCANSMVGRQYLWDEERVQIAIAQIWVNLIPVSGHEVAAAALAHGAPSHFQDRLEGLFEFGRGCLISGNKKKPQQTRRRDGEVADQFSQALRYSYHW